MKFFAEPSVEVLKFVVEDVIAASIEEDEGGNGSTGENDLEVDRS